MSVIADCEYIMLLGNVIVDDEMSLLIWLLDIGRWMMPLSVCNWMHKY
jgi:hypothetical protein